MKKLTIILTVFVFLMSNAIKASSNMKVYSHLPIELKEALSEELNNAELVFNENMYGTVWIEFHVDGNHEIHITGLSSNELSLGSFVQEILKDLPKLSENCPIEKTYTVKIRIGYTQ